ncbi:MAG: hypothetical protein MUO52_08305, partial [Desulfobacterales bacterium]|nr:hypothetical protein [Desulfobacterales bacterium]
MNWKKTIRKSAKWATLALAALILLAAALFGLAQTNTGKRHLVRLIAKAVTPVKGVRIDMGRLTGLIPFSFQLDALTFSDGEGPWLGIDGLVVHWSPFALLRGRLLVHELSAARLWLNRLPSAQEKGAAPSRGLPKWPAGLRRLLVGRFAIDELALGKDLVGRSARFRVEASILADLPTGDRKASFRLEGMDGPEAKALVDATLKGRDPVLILNTGFEEARGGLIAEALGIQGPLSLSLRGEGPLRHWKGRLLAEAGDLGRLDSEIEIEAAAEPRVRAAGSGTLSPGLLPGEAAVWLEGNTRFSVTARRLKSGILAFDQADLETGAVAVRIEQGTLDLKKRMAGGRFVVTCDDLKPLKTLTALNSAGRLKAEGTISGPLLQPEAALRLHLRDLEIDRVRLSSSDAQLRIGFLGPLGSSFPGLRLAGGGRVEGLSIRDVALPPQKKIQWEMAAGTLTGETLRLEGLKLESGKISLALSGVVDTTGPKGALDAELGLADLQPLSDFFGIRVPPTGATRLTAHLEGDGQTRALSAKIQGATTVLEQTLPPLPVILGREIRYKANVGFREATRLTLSDVQVETATGNLGGKASLDLSSKNLEGSWFLVLPRLEPFSPLLGRPLKGSVQWEGRMEGPLSELRMSGKGLGQDIWVDGLHLERVSVSLLADGLPPKSRGRLSIELQSKGHPIAGATDFILDRERLALTGISVKGAGTELTAKATLDFQQMTAEGEVKGRNPDLSSLSSLLGRKIEGSAEMETQFKIGKSAQEISFSLEGQNLESPFGQALEMRLKGRVREPFKIPGGSATLEVKGFRLRDLNLSSLTIGAEGDTQGLSF